MNASSTQTIAVLVVCMYSEENLKEKNVANESDIGNAKAGQLKPDSKQRNKDAKEEYLERLVSQVQENRRYLSEDTLTPQIGDQLRYWTHYL